MKDITIYTLTSPLHDEQSVTASTHLFLSSLGIDYDMCGPDIQAIHLTEAISFRSLDRAGWGE